MRAKMKLNSVLRTGGKEVLKFSAVCKTGGYPDSGLDEDNTYARFSPTAEVEIHVANPELFGKFEPEKKYYVDFTEAES